MDETEKDTPTLYLNMSDENGESHFTVHICRESRDVIKV